jgi:hypothetical protein
VSIVEKDDRFMIDLIKVGFPIYNEDKKGNTPFFTAVIFRPDDLFI